MGYPYINKEYQQTRYNVTKCQDRRVAGSVKYVVIHYTGTDASAKNNCVYFSGGNRNASADYFIEKDGTIYKFNANCAKYYSWHCGDGKGKYGITNSNSIGIEVVSAGEEYTKEQIKSLRKLVNAIQSDYGVKDKNVVRHYDASRKLCPAPYCGSNKKDSKWKELWKVITSNETVEMVETVETVESSKKEDKPFKIKIACDSLNIRTGPGINYSVIGSLAKNIVYTIVETENVWGRLKSGAGWVNLKYTKRV